MHVCSEWWLLSALNNFGCPVLQTSQDCFVLPIYFTVWSLRWFCQDEVFPWMWLPEGDAESATPLSCSSSSLSLLFSFLFLFPLSECPSQDTPPTQTWNYVSSDVSFQILPPDVSTRFTSILKIINERNIVVMTSMQEVNQS